MRARDRSVQVGRNGRCRRYRSRSMPPKPRPHGKRKPRAVAVPKAPTAGGGRDNKLIAMLALGGVALLAVIGIGAALAFGGGDDGSDATGGFGGGRLHAHCHARARRQSLRHDAGRHVEGVEHEPPTSGPHYQVPAVWGSFDDVVNQAQLVHNLEHGGIAIQYGTGVPAATVQSLKTFSRRSHAERFSRRIPPWEIGSPSGRGSRRARRSRRRAPRTSRSAPTSTKRPLPPSSTPTSSRARNGSRPTRSYPAAPRRLPPGWRNWSDAVGLKPTVLRDIWVRVPAPAYVPQAGRMAQSIGQPGRVIAKLSVTSTYSR